MNGMPDTAIRAAAQGKAGGNTIRLGFAGVGWIGRNRLQEVIKNTAVEAAAVADTDADNIRMAKEIVPHARTFGRFEDMLELPLDGVVIATPNALHAPMAVAALEKKCAVFCQKPLARNASEARRIVETARRVDRLLAVDFSYRYLDGVNKINRLLAGGALGEIFGANLVFHNAYGPDKAWFYDPALSGGGCLLDLGIHLVDLVLCMLGGSTVKNVQSRIYAKGKPLVKRQGIVEDYATAAFDLEDATVVSLACSWGLSAGCDAIIELSLYGTAGGAMLRNVNGSFYDFIAVHNKGTSQIILSKPPDAWGGKAIVHWAEKLIQGRNAFDEPAVNPVTVATVIDRLYAGQ